MRYAVVIEKAKKNYSAYLPDVPGCITTGKSVEETLNNLREALSLHFEGMRADGDAIPDPTTLVDYLDMDVARANQPTKTRDSSESVVRPSKPGKRRENAGRKGGTFRMRVSTT